MVEERVREREREREGERERGGRERGTKPRVICCALLWACVCDLFVCLVCSRAGVQRAG